MGQALRMGQTVGTWYLAVGGCGSGCRLGYPVGLMLLILELP